MRSSLPHGPWDELPELFLPSRVLDLAFRVFRQPEPALLNHVGFLAWVSDQDARNYFQENERLVQETLKDDIAKEKWAHHKLFKTKSKQELEAMCVAKGMNSIGKKHELVAKLAEEKDVDVDVCIYDGILNNVPSSVSQLNKESVRYLRAVLAYHGILCVGTKEELIIRIGLLKCGQQQAIFSRERKALLELISMLRELFEVEEKQNGDGVLTRKTTRRQERKQVLRKKTSFHLNAMIHTALLEMRSGQRRRNHYSGEHLHNEIEKFQKN